MLVSFGHKVRCFIGFLLVTEIKITVHRTIKMLDKHTHTLQCTNAFTDKYYTGRPTLF